MNDKLLRPKSKAPVAPKSVGYGKPPRRFQFQKGKSGNPKGRPKETRNLRDVFHEVVEANVDLAGGNGSIPGEYALMRRLFADATNSNRQQFRRFVKLARDAGLLKDLGHRDPPSGVWIIPATPEELAEGKILESMSEEELYALAVREIDEMELREKEKLEKEQPEKGGNSNDPTS